MHLGYRIALYLAAVAAITVYVVWATVEASRANLANDPSSMAWTGFLPFILPFFAADSVVRVAPFAAVIEIGLAAWRWWK